MCSGRLKTLQLCCKIWALSTTNALVWRHFELTDPLPCACAGHYATSSKQCAAGHSVLVFLQIRGYHPQEVLVNNGYHLHRHHVSRALWPFADAQLPDRRHHCVHFYAPVLLARCSLILCLFMESDIPLKKSPPTTAIAFSRIMSAALYGHLLTLNFLLGVTVVSFPCTGTSLRVMPYSPVPFQPAPEDSQHSMSD